jgi:hypothetical protein
MRMTPARRRAIIEATIDPIRPFPRGYARTKQGPFIQLCTVHSLLRSGALRPVPQCGSLRLLTARAS